MTPTAIIQKAAADGITLTLSPTGAIKATGNSEAVNHWLPIIRDNKPSIVGALSGCTTTGLAITADVKEFFEERAAIAEFDGGLTREEAETQSRNETERHKRQCWERYQKAANYILSLRTRLAREKALDRYLQEAIATYGETTGNIVGREMGGWIRFRGGLADGN